ncbi:Undecaprenyl-diphosphatase [hydrothermal vent metagenome]|uniref:Undecaprenyl-diphosphatase n=1 Tax=hydrothermal vent metagenome TaxID=652676 RepID=A0A3B1AUG0_9ZZZZ
MEIPHIFILAIVQGLTEFLPISSSAHLILTPLILGFTDQGLAFDIAVHLGSLLAIIGYFRKELQIMLRDFIGSLGTNGKTTENSRLVWLIVVSTIPIMVIGALFKILVDMDLRSPIIIAAATIGFGLLLLWADRRGKRQLNEHQLSWKDGLIIGLFQVLAIIPGTSRSGITITAGLMLGLTRQAASRFSFLLAIPTILVSGGLIVLEVIKSDASIDWNTLLLGFGLSFTAAYLCVHYFLRFVERIGMLPFVIYRLLLGGAIIVFISI